MNYTEKIYLASRGEPQKRILLRMQDAVRSNDTEAVSAYVDILLSREQDRVNSTAYLERAMLNKILYVGDQIPDSLLDDPRSKFILLGTPQEFIDAVEGNTNEAA